MKNKYFDRLVAEWIEHGNIIICVDFDDTISPWKIASPEECLSTIQILKKAKRTGAYIVIHTACDTERYSEIREYCAKHGLEINSINENPIDLLYGNDAKPYANIYIDDRAGMNEALLLLEEAAYAVDSHRYTLTEHDVEF